MSQPRQLLDLQQLDSELDQASARLAEIAQLLAEDEGLRAAQAAAEQAAGAADAALSALKRVEQDVADQNAKIARNQQVLYSSSVTNPKELEDLQQEAEALARHLGTLEERQLEAMIAFEEQQATKDAADAQLKSVDTQVNTQNSQLLAEQGNLQTRSAELAAQRPGLVDPLDPEHVAVYDKVRQKRGGLAVVRVTGANCPACGQTLTSSQAQDARSQASLTMCSACGRILTA